MKDFRRKGVPENEEQCAISPLLPLTEFLRAISKILKRKFFKTKNPFFSKTDFYVREKSDSRFYVEFLFNILNAAHEIFKFMPVYDMRTDFVEVCFHASHTGVEVINPLIKPIHPFVKTFYSISSQL